LEALGALLNLELDGLILLQGAVILPLDRFAVDKDIRAALLRYEALALFRAKPLDSASCHLPVLSFLSRTGHYNGLARRPPAGTGRELLGLSRLLHPRSVK
jgi:hypothetical protein